MKLKISIAYPPLAGKNKFGRLSQNRQFFWSPVPSFVFPVVPATAATMLKEAGHAVLWLDGMAEKLTMADWLNQLILFKPNLVMIETKTPVVKYHWEVINHLKSSFPKIRTVLVGDHVTALPRESMENSAVDYVLTGGNYDFLMVSLTDHLTQKTKLPSGIWYREKGQIKSTGQFILNQDLNRLPSIDRNLAKWQLYSRANGNFKYFPATYIMSGRDCWWRRNGGCSFCSWTTIYPKYATRSVEKVLDEIGNLIGKYNVREIFDDTGTFPVGSWLEDFCRGMIDRGYSNKVKIGCNFRFGVLKEKQYELLAKAGFRFLLFGLESASQKTVDRLGKGIRVNEVETELKLIQKINRKTGKNMEPHLTFMLGYPWETKADAARTVSLVRDFFRRGLVTTIQATVVVPYPGTRLFTEAEKNNWLTTHDWDRYDMSGSVMKQKISRQELSNLTGNIYLSSFTPSFILNRLLSIRTKEDFFYLANGAVKAVKHAVNF